MVASILQANAAFQLKIEDFMFHKYLAAELHKSLSLVDNINILMLAVCR